MAEKKQAHPRRKGETRINIRKPVDYSAMFAALDTLMAADMTQLDLYREIGRQISERPEKSTAIAAAEYLCGAYPDVPGFSPRNLRRIKSKQRRLPVMSNPRMHNAIELEALVQQMGFLPFFACSVPNFSIEEFTPTRCWSVEGVDGPWEWRRTFWERK